MPGTPPRAKHDEAYKLLFSSAAVVEGLLSAIVPDFARKADTPCTSRWNSSPGR